MKHTPTTQRVLATLLMTSAGLVFGCAKNDDAAPTSAASEGEPNQAAAQGSGSEAERIAALVGIEPGPVERSEGPAAVIAACDGTVELRRLGEETFAAAKRDDALYPGDQVRAADNARATIVFPDESTAELVEQSTLTIGSRVASADPASTAALLSGVARFSVAPRAPGEGPFVVFTPAGMVATKGTVFGVGVAADGDARVGVESGAVNVAGAASLSAPVSVEANTALDFAATGRLGSPSAWAEDDWGAWRDGAEAELDVAATADAHAKLMTDLAAELSATHTALETLGAEVASFEVRAAADASANNTADYTAGVGQAAVAIDAGFLTGMRLEWLTHAYAAHALLASELFVRHPQVVVRANIDPHVQAAVLWPKRFDAAALLYLEPLRTQYYLHHPQGRAHAQLVGAAVPDFYLAVSPPAIPAAELKAKLAFEVFTPPAPIVTASARPVWIAAPDASWHAKVSVKAAPPRGKLAFYVRPPKLRAKAVLGVAASAKIDPYFALRAPEPRGRLKVAPKFALGHSIKLKAPDLKAAAQARLAWKAEAPNAELALAAVDRHAKLDAKAKGKLEAKGKGKLDAKLQGKANAAAQAQNQIKAKLEAPKPTASAKVSVKVKAPEPPKVKASAKGSAKFSFGH